MSWKSLYFLFNLALNKVVITAILKECQLITLNLLDWLLRITWCSWIVLLDLQWLASFNITERVTSVMRDWEVWPRHWAYLNKLFHLIVLKGSKLHIATVDSLFELWLGLILNYYLSSTHIRLWPSLDLAIKLLHLLIAKHELVTVYSLEVLHFLWLDNTVWELFVNHYPYLLFLLTLGIHALVLSALLASALPWGLHRQLLKNLNIWSTVDELLLLNPLIKYLLL